MGMLLIGSARIYPEYAFYHGMSAQKNIDRCKPFEPRPYGLIDKSFTFKMLDTIGSIPMLYKKTMPSVIVSYASLDHCKT